MEPLFSPPVYIQRHQYVVDYVMINKPKKVVDLGCNDCSLLKKLKFHREIELLCGVDLNCATMKKKMHALDPIPADYLQPGASPLSIELYHGSVTRRDARLRGFDLVTSMELIEHLYPEDVELFTEVLFGFMAPGTAIVSTPNVEFNALFPRKAGFRDPDHKFEWTRTEFQSWALKACSQHGYKAEFTGVGRALPHLHLQVGFCTQMAVFQRLATGGAVPAACGDTGEEFSYTLLYSVSYPSLSDNNILRGCLVSEVLFWAHKLRDRRRRLESEDQGSPESHPEDGADGQLGPRDEESGFEEEEELHGGEDIEMSSREQLSDRRGQIRDLSGSLTRLRRFIADDPLIRLSQDGFAVVLDEGQEVWEEEEAGGMEAGGLHTGDYEEEENWDGL
ncbi:hypothetical protein NHX12_033416 [Muraenolepis orangiensis]|uniref:Small RNA 2'-O-methyltransferase n=1 Tax=Muraenolepis orangiensis TaxID=630683 RepID=A0A9Q0IIM7_9TELE|nr:hypothetical protein NHX12_033416 [Muraenolepis orangiensis]